MCTAIHPGLCPLRRSIVKHRLLGLSHHERAQRRVLVIDPGLCDPLLPLLVLADGAGYALRELGGAQRLVMSLALDLGPGDVLEPEGGPLRVTLEA